jgi:hypothetical protein
MKKLALLIVNHSMDENDYTFMLFAMVFLPFILIFSVSSALAELLRRGW